MQLLEELPQLSDGEKADLDFELTLEEQDLFLFPVSVQCFPFCQRKETWPY